MTGTPGKIQNRARAAQLRDFSGLAFGSATPSDIDCIMEIDGAAFAIVELKLSGADVDTGQRLLIARMVDTLAAGGAAAVGIVAEHYQHDCRIDIDCGGAIVKRYRWRGEWADMDTRRVTVCDALHGFFRRYAEKGYLRLTGGAMPLQNAPQGANGHGGDTSHRHETETPHKAIPAATSTERGWTR